SAAKQLGIDHRIHEIARVEDFDAVFAAILESRAQALFVPGTTLTFRERQRFADFANRNRLPSAFNQREFVEAGGLFSYGIDTWETVLQTLVYVDKILRGAKPADLPVELPSKYELVINRKTEKALGLAIPQSVLIRAERVIE
ncbi:MAG: ABC transporter substrate binding protein, partial [Burkholderiales bacterium]